MRGDDEALELASTLSKRLGWEFGVALASFSVEVVRAIPSTFFVTGEISCGFILVSALLSFSTVTGALALSSEHPGVLGGDAFFASSPFTTEAGGFMVATPI
jgi:hypothetical protein